MAALPPTTIPTDSRVDPRSSVHAHKIDPFLDSIIMSQQRHFEGLTAQDVKRGVRNKRRRRVGRKELRRQGEVGLNTRVKMSKRAIRELEKQLMNLTVCDLSVCLSVSPASAE